MKAVGMSMHRRSARARRPRRHRAADEERRVATCDGRGAHLEGDVDEAVERAGGRTHGHPVADEALHGVLHLAHVNAAGEVHVVVEHVVVAVLLLGPPADPAHPSRGVVARGVAHSLEADLRMGLRLEGRERGGEGSGQCGGRRDQQSKDGAADLRGRMGVAWICRGATRRERKGEGRKGGGWEKRGDAQGVTGK
jgi:hypothetical protein